MHLSDLPGGKCFRLKSSRAFQILRVPKQLHFTWSINFLESPSQIIKCSPQNLNDKEKRTIENGEGSSYINRLWQVSIHLSHTSGQIRTRIPWVQVECPGVDVQRKTNITNCHIRRDMWLGLRGGPTSWLPN